MRLPQSLLFAMLATVISLPAQAQDNHLSIKPVRQETPVWCWISVGEMAFKHYGLPNANPYGLYQCGIVGVAAVQGLVRPICNYDCGQCVEPAGSSRRLVQLLEGYPDVLRRSGASQVQVEAYHTRRPISKEAIIVEIDAENPIIAGISPGSDLKYNGSTADHVALIVGYEDNANTVLINDPYPYPYGQNPYLRAGATELRPLQYAIEYDKFRNVLNWTETITLASFEEDDGDDAAGLPSYCCTPSGRLGPYQNHSVSEGGRCFGTHPSYGIVVGSACY